MASVYSALYDYLYPTMFTEGFWVPNKGSALADEFKYFIIGCTILYTPAIFLGQRFMKNRQAFKLNRHVFAWNLALSFLSFLGAIVMLDDWRILFSAFYEEENYMPFTRCVVTLFTLTKILEFGDTVFLVLKKKPLMFLHIYHHLTVALYCWHAQAVNVAFAHHFVFINLCIHGIMYFYYAMAVIVPGHRLLKKFRPLITMMQTLQMFVGMYLSYNAVANNKLPHAHIVNARFALAMYTSYAWLFGKFYLENYVKGVRASMTCFVGSIHILAVVGAYTLIHSDRWGRLLCEILTTYVVTALLLYMLGDYSSSYSLSQRSYSLNKSSKMDICNKTDNNSKSTCNERLKDTDKNNKNTTGVVNVQEENDFCLSYGKSSILQSLIRMLLMLLNCLATWACEHQTFRRRLQTIDTYLKRTHTNSNNNNNVNNDCSSDNNNNNNNTEKSVRMEGEGGEEENVQNDMLKTNNNNNNSNLKTEKKKQLSLMLSLLRKIEHSSNNNNNNSNNVKNNNENKSTLNNNNNSNTDIYASPCPPTRPLDIWFALMSFGIPAIYGLHAYDDILLGLCVHGALRWIIELHTTGALMQDVMHIPKFESCKRK